MALFVRHRVLLLKKSFCWNLHSSYNVNVSRWYSSANCKLSTLRLVSWTKLGLLRYGNAGVVTAQARMLSTGHRLHQETSSLSNNVDTINVNITEIHENSTHHFANVTEIHENSTHHFANVTGSSKIRDYTDTTSVDSFPNDVADQALASLANSEILTTLEKLEPTLVSQGLGGLSPIGLVQELLLWLHTNAGLPWWGSIVVVTFMARILVFPFYVAGQKASANMSNHMPQMTAMQLRITEARQCGNTMEFEILSAKMIQFMREKKLNPLQTLIPTMGQTPVFLSFFFALRQMANLPIESFKLGGHFWFVDLTIPDPYYLLPLITCCTLALAIKFGGEGAGIAETGGNNMKLMRTILQVLPIIIFPFIINFPSALLCYWVTTNGVTLLQVLLFKIEPLREYLKIPKKIKHNVSDLPVEKGFIAGIKESYTNTKIIRELEYRAQADEMKFRKAGLGPVPKTYAYDPTKQKK